MPPQALSSPSVVVGVRLQPEIIDTLKKIAIENSAKTGKAVTHNDLIRDAIDSIYNKWFNQKNTVDFNEEFSEISFNPSGRFAFKKGVDYPPLIEALETDHGRMLISQEFVSRAIEYVEKYSVVRKVLRTDGFRRGEIPRYGRDKNNTFLMVIEDGVKEEITSEEFIVPTHTLKEHPTYLLTNIKNDAYETSVNGIDDAQKESVVNLIKREEASMFSLINSVGQKVDRYLIDDMKMYVENDDVILIPERAASKVREIFGDAVPLSAKESRKINGRFQVTNHSLDHVVVVSKEKGGVIVLRSDLTVLPCDDPAQLAIGWVLYYDMGMMVTGDQFRFFQV